MTLLELREAVTVAVRGFCPDAKPQGERIVLKKNYYAGRRFEFDKMSAVWLLDADEIKLFDRAGALLMTLPLHQPEQQVIRRAA